MGKTKIEWCDYTWNPIVGCKRGCHYCYAEKFVKRFWPEMNFKKERSYYPPRLKYPSTIKKPSVFFVGSLSDPEYWMHWMTQRVIDVCRENSQHTFMFLSKGPNAYSRHKWPKNTMQGFTIDTLEDIQTQEKKVKAFMQCNKANRKFLNVEPLLGTVCDCRGCKVEKVIVGAQTGPGAVAPVRKWLDSVMYGFQGHEIFFKDNIQPYLEVSLEE